MQTFWLVLSIVLDILGVATIGFIVAAVVFWLAITANGQNPFR